MSRRQAGVGEKVGRQERGETNARRPDERDEMRMFILPHLPEGPVPDKKAYSLCSGKVEGSVL